MSHLTTGSESVPGGAEIPPSQLAQLRRQSCTCQLEPVPGGRATTSEGSLGFEASTDGLEIGAVVRQVRDEFLDMPGLHLTPAQAMRLCGLEHDTCRAAIDTLVVSAFLRWTPGGSITRADR